MLEGKLTGEEVQVTGKTYQKKVKSQTGEAEKRLRNFCGVEVWFGFFGKEVAHTDRKSRDNTTKDEERDVGQWMVATSWAQTHQSGLKIEEAPELL